MRRFAPSLLLLLALLCAELAPGVRGAPLAEQPAPKVVFDLSVSLEWEPGSGDSLPADLALAECRSTVAAAHYLDDLQAGLRSTAAYLYTYSEGQLALGNVTIYTGGANWDQADIRVLASNAYRPSALIGGIVNAPARYPSATGSITRTVFYPGAITLSRLWNREGSRCGAWSLPDGWRTLGHEWAHYALFLYDEYFNMLTGAKQYCTTTGIDFTAVLSATNGKADSLMAYPYSTDKLWLGGGSMPHDCVGTPQQHVHGVSDWATLPHFYPALTVPAGLRTDLDFETSPARPLFSVNIMAPVAPRPDTSAEVRVSALRDARLVGQSYLLRFDSKNNVQRIIGQGKLIPGDTAALPFWGVHQDTNDRAAVLIQDWRTGQRFFYPKNYPSASALDVAAPNLLDAPASQWRPAMTITPRVTTIGAFSEVTGLTVQIKDCANVARRILVTYCPAGGDCGDPVIVSLNGGVFTHTFFFPFDEQYEPPASYGYIYARTLATSPETAALEETISWYQLAGGAGSPAYGDGFAPLAEGLAETDFDPSPVIQSDTRLLYSPAQQCTADYLFPANVRGIVDTPLDIQPVIANGNGGRPWGSDSIDPALRVRLRYNQDLLDRLGIDERQLVVLRLEAGQRRWLEMPVLGRSTEMDWLLAQKQTFGGQGEVYALGYRQMQVALPLVLR